MSNLHTRDKKQIIQQLVIGWSNNFFRDKKDLGECFQIFISSLSRGVKMEITFDNSISSCLVQLSRELRFLQFQQKKQNQLKKSLQIINQSLMQNKFISLRQYDKFKNQFLSSSVQDSMYLLKENLQEQGYLRKRNESQAPRKIDRKNILPEDTLILRKLWQVSMQISLENFWRFIIKEKIQSRNIVPIYQVYQRLVQDEISRDFRVQIGLYIKAVFLKKQQCVSPLHQLQTSVGQYDRLLDLKAQYISVYLDKQRWQKYTKQYLHLTQFLVQRCNNKSIRFQAFGSFENKFYILNYSDIDVGLLYQTQLEQRGQICSVLNKIQSSLQAERTQIPHYNHSRTYSWQIIKVPFVKVTYRNNFSQDKDIVPSMDIVINNYQGIQNSKLLALYAQDTYILKFCNLVKYWAVRTDLINVSKKIQGLSSYGVLLMSLYYLMATNQIPYLIKQKDQYSISSHLFQIKLSFLDNFIGFIKFYSYQYKCLDTNALQKGKFHKDKRIVCLLKNHEGEKVYDKTIIINMYDFIDDTNPGRMKTCLDDKFRQKFKQALRCLQDRSISFLEKIYTQQSRQSQKYINYSHRGNRFRNQNMQTLGNF